MKVILSQPIMLKNIPRTSRSISKTIESNIIPHAGDYISDSLWEDPSEQLVLSTTINYNSDECYVKLPSYEIESKNEEEVTRFIQMSKLHGWKSLF